MKNLSILVTVYAVMLLALALLGIKSQGLYRQINGSYRNAGLLEQKYDLLESITDLRHQVEQIKGPSAIRNWAKQHKMVTISHLKQVQMISPLAAPKIAEESQGSLEVYTLWR